MQNKYYNTQTPFSSSFFSPYYIFSSLPLLSTSLSTSVFTLVHNSTRPLRARNLLRSPQRQPNTAASKQRSAGPRVDASVKVEVRSVLVRARKPVLCAQRVALSRAEVGDLDDYAVASVRQLVAGRVGVGSQFPAGAAGGARALAGADAKFVLGDLEWLSDWSCVRKGEWMGRYLRQQSSLGRCRSRKRWWRRCSCRSFFRRRRRTR